MNDYEARRTSQIARNKALLAELKIPKLIEKKLSPQSPPKRKPVEPSEPVQPARKSARLAGRDSKVDYRDPDDSLDGSRSSRSKKSLVVRQTPNNGHVNVPSTIVGKDYTNADVHAMQARWTAWEPEAHLPTRKADGSFHFDSHPHFTPNKSPMEIMQEGSFGGNYWRPLLSLKLGIVVAEDWRELPSAWLDGLDPAAQLANPVYDPSVNKYGVKCGQTIEEWESAGWINHHYDVRGWFQWYCRYFQGRRCYDDDRQIQRWANCAGDTGRWTRILLKKYGAASIREVADEGLDDSVGISPAIHQTLHHWAWEIRQDLLDRFWEG